jgi:hypothetical protein
VRFEADEDATLTRARLAALMTEPRFAGWRIDGTSERS